MAAYNPTTATINYALLPSNATSTAAVSGTGYALGDLITLAGGTSTTAAILSVVQVKAVSATLSGGSGGSGGTNGACTVTDNSNTTGTVYNTRAQFSGTVSGGALTGPLTVTVAGLYNTLNPANPIAVSGCGLSGATVVMTTGVVAYWVQQPGGVYQGVPANPVSQSSSTGSGTGAQFNLTWGPIAAVIPYSDIVNGTLSNMGLGVGSLSNVTTGTENYMYGARAGKAITTGGFNSGFGTLCLSMETTGSANVCMGSDTMRNTTGNIASTAIGSQAMRNWVATDMTSLGYGTLSGNTDGSSSGTGNVAVGYNAMNGPAATTATNNTALGSLAMGGAGLTSAGNNVAIGYEAMYNATSSVWSVAIGQFAMGNVTGNGAITAVGYNAGESSASFGTFVGYEAGQTNTGSGNVAFGAGALSAAASATGGNNTTIGFDTGLIITGGASNTILGNAVGSTVLTTGSDNILIGVSSNITTAAAGTSNTINIGGTGGSWMSVTGTNTNTTEATSLFGSLTLPNISSDATHTDATLCEDTTSHTVFAGSGTAGICLGSSSLRYKERVVPVGEGLAEIEKLKPVNFYYKQGHGDNGAKEQYGFIAEDVISVLPKLTQLDKDGKPNSVDYLGMTPVLVKAVQEQQTEIDALKKSPVTVTGRPCFFGILVCAS